MELNNTLQKIRNLTEERNWSIYKLAKESEIPYSSLNSLFQKNNQPTISTLEKICKGLRISLAEFFQNETPYRAESFSFTNDEQIIIQLYRSLNTQDQKLFSAYIKGFAKKPY